MLEQSRTPGPVSTRHSRELAFGLLFGLAGGLLGGMGGNVVPAVVGAVIGAALGAVAGWSLNSTAVQKAERQASLDRTIGTEGGSIGVSNLEHPPPRIGAPSAAASGVADSVEPHEADGPILRPPD